MARGRRNGRGKKLNRKHNHTSRTFFPAQSARPRARAHWFYARFRIAQVLDDIEWRYRGRGWFWFFPSDHYIWCARATSARREKTK
ncbi:MAG: hypothetical protein KCHDKBKB_03103 [Elusimicrobia bacterium]|nr:hypothetical protein [Elusimicrobiota bacterium]